MAEACSQESGPSAPAGSTCRGRSDVARIARESATLRASFRTVAVTAGRNEKRSFAKVSAAASCQAFLDRARNRSVGWVI